ncbi:MAG: hypothetical protein D6770_03920 [Anaerolineae bacterium]|nr:MAG: hypothetical protein D6770_03920 [Anaerolineae bacterium]
MRFGTHVGILVVLTLMLTGCAQSALSSPTSVTSVATETVASWSTPLEAQTAPLPTPTPFLKTTPDLKPASEPSRPPERVSSSEALSIGVEPAMARVGDIVTYQIQILKGTGDPFVAPDILVHIPLELDALRANAPGWDCEIHRVAADSALPTDHQDVLCRSIVTGKTIYPATIYIRGQVSRAATSLRACAEQTGKAESDIVCVESQIAAP